MKMKLTLFDNPIYVLNEVSIIDADRDIGPRQGVNRLVQEKALVVFNVLLHFAFRRID